MKKKKRGRPDYQIAEKVLLFEDRQLSVKHADLLGFDPDRRRSQRGF